MCQLRPRTLAELAEINGVGERKLEKYGMVFLEAIKRLAPRRDLRKGAA
jgi:ATP-dependent DNA helicase RecQ